MHINVLVTDQDALLNDQEFKLLASELGTCRVKVKFCKTVPRSDPTPPPQYNSIRSLVPKNSIKDIGVTYNTT